MTLTSVRGEAFPDQGGADPLNVSTVTTESAAAGGVGSGEIDDKK
jgi:hypothetical protein